MLASVARMEDAGNEVHFSKKGGYIRNADSGVIMPLRRERNLYMLDVWFLKEGGSKEAGSIVVDSGASEHVMPKDMLMDVKMLQRKPGVKFMAANGGEMEYLGMKDIKFIPRGGKNESGFGRRA